MKTEPPISRDLLELAWQLLKIWLPKEFLDVGLKAIKQGPTDEFGLDPNLVWYLRPLFEFLYYYYFRVDASGMRNVPPQEPAIIVANHAGSLPYDGVMINLALYNEHPKKRPVRFLVHDFAFDLPLIGTIVERAGGVRASPENAKRLLAHKQLILVFPEGIRGIGKPYEKRYKLQRFGRGGFIRLAIKERVPIIPTAVIGSEEIHPIVFSSNELAKPLGVPFFPLTPTFPWLGPLGLIPLPTKWKIIFGKPISFKKYKKADADDDDLMQKLADDVRIKVQSMVNAALAKRKSIWF